MDVWETFQSLLEALRNFKLALRHNKLACNPEDFPGLEDLEEFAPEEREMPAKATTPATLWQRLIEEQKFELINKLRYAEIGEPGFATIVVPREGFSEEDETHNQVLGWLREHEINVCNPNIEITRMERALYGKA